MDWKGEIILPPPAELTHTLPVRSRSHPAEKPALEVSIDGKWKKTLHLHRPPKPVVKPGRYEHRVFLGTGGEQIKYRERLSISRHPKNSIGPSAWFRD